ncbi:hypothetical protein B0H17DRAFT_1197941 [Mycena rosella]|uniref:Uncharacterized protein n=1 Tax=Mycena rosella TaxID=1033263 RepID=A0AAD7GLD6_MYCRO|nr:hypothetical protein B0H17DRAFT_1197941 [Mycena rosella]
MSRLVSAVIYTILTLTALCGLYFTMSPAPLVATIYAVATFAIAATKLPSSLSPIQRAQMYSSALLMYVPMTLIIGYQSSSMQMPVGGSSLAAWPT